MKPAASLLLVDDDGTFRKVMGTNWSASATLSSRSGPAKRQSRRRRKSSLP
jgi:hypothetical protein